MVLEVASIQAIPDELCPLHARRLKGKKATNRHAYSPLASRTTIVLPLEFNKAGKVASASESTHWATWTFTPSARLRFCCPHFCF